MRNRILIRAAVLFLCAALSLPLYARADLFGPDTLLTGQTENPVSVTVSGPAYKQIARFGTERTDSLNRVLKHLGLTVTLDGRLSETAFSVDGSPAFSYLEITDDTGLKRIYSFEPDTAYILRENSQQADPSGFNGFLENQFYPINRLLDEMYPVFEKSAEAFGDFAKSAAVSLNFRGYGKGVRQTTIALSAQYVSEQFPQAAAALAETDTAGELIQRLLFKGPQKIMLLYDQDDRLLRIKYDGEAGFSEESMRNVSVSWRCVRNGAEKKDNLTLKTPAKKGTDRYNVTYEREIIPADDSSYNMKWDLQADLKEDTVRKKISFTADLSDTAGQLDGKILYTGKQDGAEHSVSIVPSVKKENEAEYSGTIEITDNSGKIVTSAYTAGIRIVSGSGLSVPTSVNEIPADPREDAGEDASDPVQDRINSILIRKMLTLPQEDLGFFSTDIPAELWTSLLQSF